MTSKRNAFGFVFVAAAGAYSSVIACGSTPSDDGSDLVGDDGGTVSNGDATNGDATNGPCDVTLTPAQNACVVDETLGIFVSSTTAGANPDGTRAHPYPSFAAGIAAAKTQKKRVYACIGDYKEQVTLVDGVSMFGDLDCNQSWKVVSSHAQVKAPTSPAVRADQIQSATRFDAIDAFAPDGSASSKSSIGFLVTSSPGLIVANATIQAGNGLDGIDGVDAPQLLETGSPNGTQRPASGICTKVGSFINCGDVDAPGGTSVCSFPDGGVADDGGLNGGTGGGGGHGGGCYTGGACPTGEPPVPVPCCINIAFQPDGAGAPAGTPSQPGANGNTGENAVIGSLSATGYTPADGAAGTNGGPGTGGSGAAGSPVPVSEGSSVGGISGGAGGCPGLAGSAGTGGGASIAIIASDGAITLDTCILHSSSGGRAGLGTFGSTPTSGGTGATSGGAGGDSGWSGNGSSGPSYALATHGAAAVQKNATLQNGAGGHGVAVRASGAKTIPTTPDGASAPSIDF